MTLCPFDRHDIVPNAMGMTLRPIDRHDIVPMPQTCHCAHSIDVTLCPCHRHDTVPIRLTVSCRSKGHNGKSMAWAQCPGHNGHIHGMGTIACLWHGHVMSIEWAQSHVYVMGPMLDRMGTMRYIWHGHNVMYTSSCLWPGHKFDRHGIVPMP
jgi:hypothetical protein